MASQNRILELDGVRGIAASMVVIYHLFLRYDQIFGHSFSVPEVFELGFYGVRLFFILSGFVIFWTVTRTSGPIGFAWARMVRLYPAYWTGVLLTATVVALAGLPGREVSSPEVVKNLTMASAFLGARYVDGVYWTLTIELLFYGTMFLVMATHLKGRIQEILILVLPLAWWLQAVPAPELPIPHVFAQALPYLGDFAFGIALFHVFAGRSNGVTTMLLFLSATYAVGVEETFQGQVTMALLMALFVLAMKGQARWLRSPVLVFLGTVSYAWYLIHQNISYVIINAFYDAGLSPALSIPVALAATLMIAALIHKHVEAPSGRFLRGLRLPILGQPKTPAAAGV